MAKLQKRGKGIILMHDFRPGTAEAMPELLRQLKAGGYKVVHMVPKRRSLRWRSMTIWSGRRTNCQSPTPDPRIVSFAPSTK